METIEILQQILPLITGFVGLISTGIATYFAIANYIKSLKTKKTTEIWTLIMTIADAAMKEAEASQLNNEGKKQLVIDTVKAGLIAAGLDITDFLEQLSDYIDDTIAFVKEMQKAKELNK